MPTGRYMDTNIMIGDNNYMSQVSDTIMNLSNCFAVSAEEAGDAIATVSKAITDYASVGISSNLTMTTMDLEQRISILEAELERLINQQPEETNMFLRNIKW